MEKAHILENNHMKSKKTTVFLALLVITVISLLFYKRHNLNYGTGHFPLLTVAISPYQDLAMLVNAGPVGIAEKHGIQVKLITMAWENILPAVGSRGKTVDVGFGSFVEYLTKYAKLNEGEADPILFIQPLYVYKGGGFIALKAGIPVFSAEDLRSPKKLASLRKWKFGAQKESLYDMMLYSIAARGGISPKDLKVTDIPMNDGLLAVQSKSLDLSAGGLTQVTEIQKMGGRLAVSMEDAGFADITGFICRKSVLDSRRADLENLVRVWFDCVDYVFADINANSANSLAYLKANAATRYTLEEYSSALSQEYLPRSINDLNKNILGSGSRFDIVRIGKEVNEYLISRSIIKSAAIIPSPILSGK